MSDIENFLADFGQGALVLHGDPFQPQPLFQPVPVKQTRKRKPTVASVIRQMKRAGVEIAGCEINPRDGTVRVITGKPIEMKAKDDRNEWDTVQ